MRVALLSLLALLAACATPLEESPSPGDDELRPVLEELHATLLRIEENATLASQAGRAGSEDVLEAARERLEVELRLATTAEERVAVRDEQLRTARAVEEQARARFEAGRSTEYEMLRARAARLELEAQRLADAAR